MTIQNYVKSGSIALALSLLTFLGSSITASAAHVIQVRTAAQYDKEVLQSKIPVFVTVVPVNQVADEDDDDIGLDGPGPSYYAEKAHSAIEQAFGPHLEPEQYVKFVEIHASRGDPDNSENPKLTAIVNELDKLVPVDAEHKEMQEGRPLTYFLVNGKPNTTASGCNPCFSGSWYPKNIDLYVEVVLGNVEKEQGDKLWEALRKQNEAHKQNKG